MTLFAYIVESQLCICALYGLYRALLRGKIACHFSRIYLLSAVPVSLLLPLVSFPVNVPGKAVETITYLVSYLPPVFVNPFPEKGAPGGFTTGSFSGDLLVLVYLLGFFFLAGLFLCKFYKLFFVLRGCRKKEFGQTTVFLSKEGRGAFAVFGWIVIEERIFQQYGSSRYLGHIIHHEALHCKLMHTADLVFMLVQKMVLWFNPVVWSMEKYLKECHEYEVDDRLIRSGADPRQYAQLLIDFEMGFMDPYPASSFSYLSIKNRIEMITKMNVKKRNVRIALALPLMGLFLILSSFASACYIFEQERVVLVTPEQTTADTVATVPLMMADVKPKFQGGDQNAFTRWVFEQIQYPENARKNKVQGKVTLQFTVTETGKVCDVRVVKSVSKELDDESVRVVSSSPDWEPGIQGDKPVRVRMTFPIIFSLK